MMVNKELSKQDDILQQKLDTFYTEALPIPSEDSQIEVITTINYGVIRIGWGSIFIAFVATFICKLIYIKLIYIPLELWKTVFI